MAAEICGEADLICDEARKNGIVSLEQQAAAIADPFLRKAMIACRRWRRVAGLAPHDGSRYRSDGTQAEAEAKVWEAAGGYAPTVGIIGAVLGLIQVMKHLEDIRVVGDGIAVAFVATVYGVGSANFFFLPVAAKLRARLREAVLIKEMVLEGVSGIAQGLNPTLIRVKLESYCPPAGIKEVQERGKAGSCARTGAIERGGVNASRPYAAS